MYYTGSAQFLGFNVRGNEFSSVLFVCGIKKECNLRCLIKYRYTVALCSRNANISVVFVVSNYCFKGTELIRILFKQRTELCKNVPKAKSNSFWIFLIISNYYCNCLLHRPAYEAPNGTFINR